MIYDKESEEFWIYSDRTVCKLVIANEDRDAWKLLMEKKKYMEAYEIGKKYQSGFTDYVEIYMIYNRLLVFVVTNCTKRKTTQRLLCII